MRADRVSPPACDHPELQSGPELLCGHSRSFTSLFTSHLRASLRSPWFPPLRLFALRLHRGAVHVSGANTGGDYGEVIRHRGSSSARQSCPALQHQSHLSHRAAAACSERNPCRCFPSPGSEGRGSEGGGGYMGELLDCHHPVVANLCPGWGRSRSCWKPPGPGMSPWWRNY